MSVRGWIARTRKGPRGAWSALENIVDGSPMRAFRARNMRFSPGKAYSREGSVPRAAGLSGAVQTMHNWITGLFNIVMFSERGAASSEIRRVQVSTSLVDDMFTGLSASVRGMTVAEAGHRAYIAVYNQGASSAGPGLVTNGIDQHDQAFQEPLVFITATAVDSGPGGCTIGQHYIGFIFQSRSGFSGKPSPVSAFPGPAFGLFQVIPVFLGGDNRQITVSVTLNTPAEAGPGSALYPIMTRADNVFDWFFVPGVVTVLPASVISYSFSVNINISDENLAARAELANDQFFVLAQDLNSTPPIQPSVVLEYRHRVAWVADNKCYVSEIDDPQYLTEDQHVVQTNGAKRIITAFPYGQSLWLVGDKWVAESSDNGDIPILWSQPKEIAGIGTLAPRGVEWRTAGQYVWMACEDGLRLFRGVFDPIPVTYLFQEWQQINWAQAAAIQVVDDIVNHKCYVAVPLITPFTPNPTDPTHLITVDYTQGLGYNEVDISLDNFSWGNFAAICAVKDSLFLERSMLWIGPDSATTIYRFDQNSRTDNALPIDAVWESGYLRRASGETDMDSNFIRVGNASIAAFGSGLLAHTWQSTSQPAGAANVTPAVLPMDLFVPSGELFTKFDLHPVEDFNVRLSIAGEGFFTLTGLTVFMKKSLYNP